MKTRSGFVSNSSSSSFIIEKRFLSPEQIKQIKNHKSEFLKFENYLTIYGSWYENNEFMVERLQHYPWYDSELHNMSKFPTKELWLKEIISHLVSSDSWSITDTAYEKDDVGILILSTSMNNFDMELFLKTIDVKEKYIINEGTF
jgi:hypothetical protein